MRNMSFALTTAQIKARTKSVTRRMHWQAATAGTLLCAVEKSQGLRPGEAIKRLTIIRVADRRREPLRRMIDDEAYGAAELMAEGFPDMTPAQFVDMFCDTHAKCTPDSKVTRIAFEYPTVACSLLQSQRDSAWCSILWVGVDTVDYYPALLWRHGLSNEPEARIELSQMWPFVRQLDAIEAAPLVAASFPKGFHP